MLEVETRAWNCWVEVPVPAWTKNVDHLPSLPSNLPDGCMGSAGGRFVVSRLEMIAWEFKMTF